MTIHMAMIGAVDGGQIMTVARCYYTQLKNQGSMYMVLHHMETHKQWFNNSQMLDGHGTKEWVIALMNCNVVIFY
nr:MAG TPA: hypothetical protein [Caudoviricetes sp.]